MRIALVTREYPPETAWGGIGQFYSALARGLHRAGVEVEVFAQGLEHAGTDMDNGILVHRVLPRKFLVGVRSGGDLAGMPASYLGIFAVSLAVEMHRAFASRHRVRPFDVVEGHEHLGVNAIVNFFPHTAATVTRLHSSYHSLVSRKLERWPRSSLIARLERYSISSADARVAGSTFIARIASDDFPGCRECDEIIPLLCDEVAGSTSREDFAERELLIAFAGRLVATLKNPELLAAAFVRLADRFPGWRLEFAGIDTPASANQSAWQQCVSVLGGYVDRTRYHGAVSRLAVEALFKRARIVVVPSSFESFGLTALEAMACGAVPVVSDRTALPEVVGQCGVVFRNGSLDDLTAKLVELLADEERQRRLSVLAAKRAKEVFSNEHLIGRNIQLYERLAFRRTQA